MEDIPHPTTIEYKEHHESIKKILVAIDGMIADEAMPKNEFEFAGFTKEESIKLQEISRRLDLAPLCLINALRGFVPLCSASTKDKPYWETNPEYTDIQREALIKGLNMLRAQIKPLSGR
jgi:hypothetical protein